jgi:hypothetical protein
MDKSVCPGQDYIAFLDPVTGKVTARGVVRFGVNLLVGWVLLVVGVSVVLLLGQLL